MHILFVDDTFETRDLFRLCFSLAGHTADTAHNGPEAVQIFQQNAARIDIIILDYHMPQMNGLEVVEHLRQLENVSLPPIVLFTSDQIQDFSAIAQKLDIARVVHKPIMPDELIAIAAEVLKAN